MDAHYILFGSNFPQNLYVQTTQVPCDCVPTHVLFVIMLERFYQQDGEVDVLLARKKRRLHNEYDACLIQAVATRENLVIVSERWVERYCVLGVPRLQAM